MPKSSGSKIDQYFIIGQRIKYYREKAKISQATLSKKIGFHSPTAIFFIEKGKRRIKVFDLVEIARILNVNILLLIFGEISNKTYFTNGT